MTEQLQQLRGKSLSNEQHGNTAEAALSLTTACSQHSVDQNTYLGMHDLVVVVVVIVIDGTEDCVLLSGLQNLNES